MKNSTIKEIQSLFETGEIETIKFSKTGKVSVKYVKEKYIIQHAKSDNIIEEIKEYAEIYKSLEKSVKKPKLVDLYFIDKDKTKPTVKISSVELNRLDVIHEEVSPRSYTYSGTLDLSEKQIKDFKAFCKGKSIFERFYDTVGKWLGGGKSFAPNELKTFA